MDHFSSQCVDGMFRVCCLVWTWSHLLSAGPERRSAVIEQSNKEIVAYHEGGHALVALYTPGEHVARRGGRQGVVHSYVCFGCTTAPRVCTVLVECPLWLNPVSPLLQGALPIHKATIVPRGSALGMVCLCVCVRACVRVCVRACMCVHTTPLPCVGLPTS